MGPAGLGNGSNTYDYNRVFDTGARAAVLISVVQLALSSIPASDF
jgi:hypothetical protein